MAIGCLTRSVPQYVDISINIKGRNDTVFSIVSLDPLTYEEHILSETGIDSSGEGHARLRLPGPRFVWLNIGDHAHPIFLAPGLDIDISFGPDGPSEDISFKGRGAIANGYLANTHGMIKRLHAHHSNIMSQDLERFTTILDSMSNVLDTFHKDYVDSTSLPLEISEIMKVHGQLCLLNIGQNYRMVHGDKLKNSSGWISTEPPFDARYLDLGMIEYAMALDRYLQTKIYPPIWEKNKSEAASHTRERLPLISVKKIKNSNFPREIQGFLEAKNIGYWLKMEGITPLIDSMYRDYKRISNRPEYMTTLEEEYQDWLAIAKGRSAPGISVMDDQGNPFSLEDQKGKVVYIDIWATWCGPCIKGFPHYERLMEGLAEQMDDITFLFISVDKDTGKWQDFLKEKDLPEGIHLIEKADGQHLSIYETYKIWGIPRYIILDREGRIIDANAPGPFSKKISRTLLDTIDGKKT